MGLASAIPHPSSLIVSAENSVLMVLAAAACLALVAAAIWLVGVTKRLSHQSVWAHEHFSGATLAQFLYVAAQCGIFSFLINYMTSEPPSLPSSWLTERTSKWIEVRTAFTSTDFKDVPALAAKLTAKADPVSAFLASNLSDSTRLALTRLKEAGGGATAVRVALAQDLNSLVLKTNIYMPDRFSGVTLQDATKQLLRPAPRRIAWRGSTGGCSPRHIRRNSVSRTAFWA